MSVVAVSKIYLHCAKYPHLPVFGVLIGDDNGVEDSIPLFHGHFLSPMFEASLSLIEIHGKKVGKEIKGCYYASENEHEFFSLGVTLAMDKILSLYPKSMVLSVNNSQMHPKTLSNMLIIAQKEKGQWKRTSECLKITTEAADYIEKALKDRKAECLCDFDNFLTDPSRDWFNLALFA